MNIYIINEHKGVNIKSAFFTSSATIITSGVGCVVLEAEEVSLITATMPSVSDLERGVCCWLSAQDAALLLLFISFVTTEAEAGLLILVLLSSVLFMTDGYLDGLFCNSIDERRR